MNLQAKYYLDKAVEQLNINSEQTDIYACLELRQCLESLAYKKIQAYGDRLPKDILTKWQPAQLLKLLEDFEPYSKYDKKVKITNLETNNCLEYKQNEISSKFINERYHKLSSYLHVTNKSKTKLHHILIKIAKELEKYVNNEIYGTIAHTNTFTCTQCKKDFIRNSKSIKEGDIVTCYNPNCKAEYLLKEKVEKGYKIQLLQAEMNCDCGNTIYLNTYQLKDKNECNCNKCNTKYIVTKVYIGQIKN